MKAIIMAGGEGTRLRPLTCKRPKPMMPVVNRPMMEYILELLKTHGIHEIGVTLQYLPGAIRDYFGNGADFGVHMRYYVEEVPLGTAGSVKNAQEFLDQTFVVISGDALTDLDLSRAMEFHRQKGSIATLVLKQVDCPLEYGVVITGKDQKVTQFLEKPSWGEVFSDTVNTGIYILEPEVLNYFEPGQKFDFSKDLFPMLLKDKKPMFGIALPGYWCDIGNLQQYVQAHQDCLTGKVKVSIPGKEVAPGIWIGENTKVHPKAQINGPALIGENCSINASAVIDAFSVIGNGSVVQEQATIKRSVIWDNAYIGFKSSVRGAVIASGVKVNSNSAIYEGSVVGSDSILKERSLLNPDVKLWPGKVIEAGANVGCSLVWGTTKPKNLFGIEGITGLANIDITPEFACRVGAAYGAGLGMGARVGVSSDSFPASVMIKDALVCGLQSAGVEVLDFGQGITPMHRFAVRAKECKSGIHVRVHSPNADKINLLFTNEKGGNITRAQERKIEGALDREDSRRIEAKRIIPITEVQGVVEAYIQNLLQGINAENLQKTGQHLVLLYNGANLETFVSKTLGTLGISSENLELEAHPKDWQTYLSLLEDIQQAVEKHGKATGAILDHNADRLIIVDGNGTVISDEMLTAMLSLIILKEKGGPVIVPVTAPRAIDQLADRYKGMVVRTKTSQQDFLDKILSHSNQNGEPAQYHMMNFDGLSALIRVLDFCAREGITLSELLAEVPEFFLDKKEVVVPWEAKGRVIRRLIEEQTGEMELLDGVKVFHPQGWALVLPDPEEPLCRVFTEGISMEVAEELTDFYTHKINEIAGA